MAHLTAYQLGHKAGFLKLAHSLNPYPEHTHSSGEWARGWICATGEQLRATVEPLPRAPAVVIPHPSLTGDQVELLCRREGLELAHLGRARFALVQTSAPAQTMLRIAAPPDFRRDRRRLPRGRDPEAA